jgi:hypothetical protein
MPPDDQTPLGDEMVHRLPERKFPQPAPGEASDEPPRGEPGAETDMSTRPQLPEHPERMAADVEDEEADPVVDTGPGIDDGPVSFGRAKGMTHA